MHDCSLLIFCCWWKPGGEFFGFRLYMRAILNGGLWLWEKFTGEIIVKVARAPKSYVSHYQSPEQLLGRAWH
jgi:hypothetical protein